MLPSKPRVGDPIKADTIAKIIEELDIVGKISGGAGIAIQKSKSGVVVSIRGDFASSDSTVKVVMLTGSLAGLGWYLANPVVWRTEANPTVDASLTDLVNLTKTNDGTPVVLVNLQEVDSAASTHQLSTSGKPLLFIARLTSISTVETPPRVIWATDGIPVCGS